MMARIFPALRTGGRLVVVDRGPGPVADGHEVAMQAAARELRQEGFEILYREDPFIHRPGNDSWWLLVSRKP
jgi:hypothetical protein